MNNPEAPWSCCGLMLDNQLGRRITLEAAQKVFIKTRFCSCCIFGESTVIVLVLSWAASGLDLGLFSPRNFWIFAPLIALIPFALLAHIPWPDLVQVKYEGLPSAPGGSETGAVANSPTTGP